MANAIERHELDLATAIIVEDPTIIQQPGQQGPMRNKTAIQYAAEKGHWDVVQSIIQNGMNSSLQRDNAGFGSILLKALTAKQEDVVLRLILKKVSLNYRDEQGNSYFHLATTNKLPQVFRALLSVNPAFLRDKNQRGQTALDLAHEQNDAETISLLEKIYLEDAIKRRDMADIYDVLSKRLPSPSERNIILGNGQSPLLFAATYALQAKDDIEKTQWLQIILYLLQCGVRYPMALMPAFVKNQTDIETLVREYQESDDYFSVLLQRVRSEVEAQAQTVQAHYLHSTHNAVVPALPLPVTATTVDNPTENLNEEIISPPPSLSQPKSSTLPPVVAQKKKKRWGVKRTFRWMFGLNPSEKKHENIEPIVTTSAFPTPAMSPLPPPPPRAPFSPVPSIEEIVSPAPPIRNIRAEIAAIIKKKLEQEKPAVTALEVYYQIDFYTCVQGLYHALQTNSNDATCIENIKLFFAQREKIILNTSRDYDCADSSANQVCVQIADIIKAPGESPYDVLLHKAKTENRTQSETWYNWHDEERPENLPYHRKDFFRLGDDTINLYAPVIEQVFGNMQEEATWALDRTWQCSDWKNNARGRTRSLTLPEILQLRQRGPAIAKLVDYTIVRHRSLQKEDLYNVFVALRDGLREGSVSNRGAGGGTEAEAGQAAGLAVEIFREKWKTISPEHKRTISELRVAGNHRTLGQLIHSILGDSSCVDLKQKYLTVFLNDEHVMEVLGRRPLMSNDQLALLKQSVMTELEQDGPTIHRISLGDTPKNYFLSLSQSAIATQNVSLLTCLLENDALPESYVISLYQLAITTQNVSFLTILLQKVSIPIICVLQAVKEKRWEIVNQIVEYKIENGQEVVDSGRILLKATKAKQDELATLLHQKNPSTTWHTSGREYAIHWAVKNKCYRILDLLAADEKNLARKNEGGRTALDYAVFLQDQEAIKILKKHELQHLIGSLSKGRQNDLETLIAYVLKQEDNTCLEELANVLANEKYNYLREVSGQFSFSYGYFSQDGKLPAARHKTNRTYATFEKILSKKLMLNCAEQKYDSDGKRTEEVQALLSRHAFIGNKRSSLTNSCWLSCQRLARTATFFQKNQNVQADAKLLHKQIDHLKQQYRH